MVILDNINIETMRPKRGCVVVEVSGLLNETVTIGNGLDLQLQSTNTIERSRNSSKRGVVYSVPSETAFGTGWQNVDEYCNVERGDVVYFAYDIIAQYLNEQESGETDGVVRVARKEDRYFVFVPYPMLFVREREGIKEALNGFVIGRRPFEDKVSELQIKDVVDTKSLVVEVPWAKGSEPRGWYKPEIGERVSFRGLSLPVDSDLFNKSELYYVRPQAVIGTYKK